MNRDRAMIIKWNDAYPIESSRLKSMAVHIVHLLPSTCATSVDASFGKSNNINVTNDDRHQLGSIDVPRSSTTAI